VLDEYAYTACMYVLLLAAVVGVGGRSTGAGVASWSSPLVCLG